MATYTANRIGSPGHSDVESVHVYFRYSGCGQDLLSGAIA